MSKTIAALAVAPVLALSVIAMAGTTQDPQQAQFEKMKRWPDLIGRIRSE